MPKRKRYLDNGGKPDRGISDSQYYNIMRKVANDNYRNWGFDNPTDAYNHAINDRTYDYRGYYNKYPNGKGNAIDHWTDEFKTVYHPTFSDESVYSGKVHPVFNPNGFTGGMWLNDIYIPPKYQSTSKLRFGNGGRLQFRGGGKSSFVRSLENQPTILEQVAEYNRQPRKNTTKETYKQQRIREQKAANQRERNIAKQYLAAGPNISNLARAAYHWYNSVPILGGQPEDGNDYITGIVDVPGMRNPKSIIKGVSTITKANAAKITPAQWTAAQDAAIARGDMTEAQRLRDLHFKVNASDTKIIDKDGNPLHTYHGGQKGITTFLNPNEFDASIKLNNYYKDGRNRIGIYTSDWKSYANQYAKGYKKKDRAIYDLYLNIENPKYVSYSESQLNRLRNLNPFRKRNYLNPSVIRPEHKKQLLSEHDGVKWDIENIVFDGKQIKSADAVTYDNNGVRIPLGERDNFNINDIRYAIAPILAGGVGYGAYRNQKASGGTIHIAPSKRGTFTAAAIRHGMGVQEFANTVLRNKDRYSPSLVKKANFARNASKWNH